MTYTIKIFIQCRIYCFIFFLETADGRFKLQDLLFLPYQRILKYHIIFKEILSKTPNDHAERQSTMLAYESMVDMWVIFKKFHHRNHQCKEKIGFPDLSTSMRSNEIQSWLPTWRLFNKSMKVIYTYITEWFHFWTYKWIFKEFQTGPYNRTLSCTI
jgi:hypothetical protein